MKNPGSEFIKNTTVENFTSDFGIKFRRLINPIFRKVGKCFTKKKFTV
jgi:hypothetical protein